MFPTKAYGDVALPAGQYEALKISIGEAEGENWWCVVFPPLCYVDVAKTEIPEEEKTQLKYILTNEQYNLITSNDGVSVKFKIVEMWQNAVNNKRKPILVDGGK